MKKFQSFVDFLNEAENTKVKCTKCFTWSSDVEINDYKGNKYWKCPKCGKSNFIPK